MTERFDYARYVALFNAGEDERLVDEFWRDDCEMLTAERQVKGRDGLKAFLAWAHDGVRETLHPVAVARDGDTVLAEVDIAFTATRDHPDFALGALKAGERFVIKFFAVYELEDERIRRLKTMRWPIGRGVEQAVA
jgi:hypothetical protein